MKPLVNTGPYADRAAGPCVSGFYARKRVAQSDDPVRTDSTGESIANSRPVRRRCGASPARWSRRSIAMFRSFALCCVVTLCASLPMATAQAADSHAPHGARLDWLPRSEWVMSSWLPYDESRLYSLLGVDRATVAAWLDDRRELGTLAAQRGYPDRRRFAQLLVAGRGVLTPRQRRVLTRRALATLTQAHLARHVFFHVFHTPAIADAAAAIFGVTPSQFRRSRDRGMTPTEIGATGGRSATQIRGGVDAVLKQRAQLAIKTGAMSPAQSLALRAEQEVQLDRFLTRHFRTPDQQLQFLCGLHA